MTMLGVKETGPCRFGEVKCRPELGLTIRVNAEALDASNDRLAAKR